MFLCVIIYVFVSILWCRLLDLDVVGLLYSLFWWWNSVAFHFFRTSCYTHTHSYWYFFLTSLLYVSRDVALIWFVSSVLWWWNNSELHFFWSMSMVVFICWSLGQEMLPFNVNFWMLQVFSWFVVYADSFFTEFWCC